MGNRSSSHYPPPPLVWSQGHPNYPVAYTGPPGAYDAKRVHNGPSSAAYAEPYMPHPILCRSMISLNADSGYMTSPSDSERMRLSKGSRMSLNHLDFVEQQRPLLFTPDLKTIKKLEKMEKKQQKLLKKYGGRSIVPPPPPPPPAIFLQSQMMPPPPPLYSRTMSFDDLHRNHVLVNDPRQRDLWRVGARLRSSADHQPPLGRPTMSNSHTTSQVVHGSSLTSSPVTSISEGQTADVWRVSPGRRDGREMLSPTSEESAVQENASRIADSKKGDKPKSVEIKVERTERVERREKFDNKDWLNSNDIYDISKMQPSLGSRSSLATSQARGESSDIDFSWIREEENKLRNERENIKQLPKCYFGMDPPKIEDTPLSCNIREEKENRRTGNGNVRTTAAAFEKELIREKRDQKSRSSTYLDDHQVAQRELGPMARRLQRMQREAEVASRNYGERDDRQKWRSSMAF